MANLPPAKNFHAFKERFKELDKEAVQLQKDMQTKMEKKAKELAEGSTFHAPAVARKPSASPNALKTSAKPTLKIVGKPAALKAGPLKPMMKPVPARQKPTRTTPTANPVSVPVQQPKENILSKSISNFQSVDELLQKDEQLALSLFFDKSVEGLPPILLAAKMGDKANTNSLMKLASKNRLDLNRIIFPNNKTIFHEAINMNIPEETLMILLSDEKINVSLPDANGNTVLHLFCGGFCGNDPEGPSNLLVQRGAEQVLNIKNRQGMTALHKCATNYTCGSKILQILMNTKKADLNIQDQDGHTPLHIACHCSNDEVASLLVQNGANINLHSSKQLKPLDIAVVTNNQALIHLLRPNISKERRQSVALPSPVEKGPDLSAFVIEANTISVESLSPVTSGLMTIPSSQESSGTRSVSVLLTQYDPKMISQSLASLLLSIPQHPNLFKPRGIYSLPEGSWVVTQSDPNYLALETAVKEWRKVFTERFTFRVLTGLCFGLLQLHSRGLAANLSLSSLYVDQSGDAKIQFNGVSADIQQDLDAFAQVANLLMKASSENGAKFEGSTLPSLAVAVKETTNPVPLDELAEILDGLFQLSTDPLQEKLRIFEGMSRQQQETINQQKEDLLEKEDQLEQKILIIQQKEEEIQKLKVAVLEAKLSNPPQEETKPENTRENTQSENIEPENNEPENEGEPDYEEDMGPDVLYDVKTLVDSDLNGTLSLQWDDFAQILYSNTCASMEDIAKICYLVADRRGEVQIRQWDHVLLWFSPLYPNDTIMTSLENAWKFEEMVEIVGQEYFWGFLSANQAAELLSTRPSGSYLLRFSSQPGFYALSLACSNQFTMHWRIKAFKDQNNQTNLYVDDRHYSSFANFIQIHQTEALEIVGSFTRETVCLQTPVQRF